uniref:Uncharacterized protein n=1 Tax=Panagrolaimus sp. JU765 TaxID=591449 RepID=A0AC34RIL9_9BILA
MENVKQEVCTLERRTDSPETTEDPATDDGSTSDNLSSLVSFSTEFLSKSISEPGTSQKKDLNPILPHHASQPNLFPEFRPIRFPLPSVFRPSIISYGNPYQNSIMMSSLLAQQWAALPPRVITPSTSKIEGQFELICSCHVEIASFLN